MTKQDLDDLEVRLAKGWVIRRDQIEQLIRIARAHLAMTASIGTPIDTLDGLYAMAAPGGPPKP